MKGVMNAVMVYVEKKDLQVCPDTRLCIFSQDL